MTRLKTGKRKQRGDAGVWALVGIALFVAGVLIGSYFWAEAQCETVCGLNGDEHNYLVGPGCYCLDERGAYNPRDERGPQ